MSKRSLPWLQFYPADWLSDSVAGCSLAAQGLWFRMLFVAHNARRYGHLEADGKAIPDEQLSRRCGCSSVDEYRSLLAELFAAGVPSRTSEGIIYSRRMVRDQLERDSAAERQRRHRSHASVTSMSQEEVRSQRSEVRSQIEENPAAARAAQSVAFQSALLTVTQTQDARLADVYAWVDRPQEYRKMDLWLAANRPGRKVKNALAFCQNWFNKIPCPSAKGSNYGKSKIDPGQRTRENLKAAGLLN
jgi:hypothetical protein